MPATLLLDPARPAVTLPRSARAGAWRGALCALVALLYIGASVGPALFDQNEAQYAGAAREMLERPGDYLPSTHGQLERGNWLVPTNDGIPRLQKPPLVYWLLMASMRIFGVNEFAARLPNALAVLAWAAATALIGRQLGGGRFGFAGALILTTMAGVFIFGHLVAPEPYLAASLTLTFWCILAGCQSPGRAAGWMRLAWVFMAIGCLSKGLHGAAYPLAAAGIVAWRRPQDRPALRELLRPAGPLLFFAMLAPWYAATEHRFPGFLRDQLINEQWGHVVNNRFPRDSVTVPLWTFCVQHLALFLPWTFFLPAALTARRDGRWVFCGAGRDLLVAWFAVTAASVLISSLQDYYLMTAWGPVALWLARPWAGERPRLPRWAALCPGVAFAAIGVVAAVAAGWLQWGNGESHAPDHLTAGRDSMLAVVTGFSTATWGRLLPLAWGAAGLLLAGGAACIACVRRGQFERTLPFTAAMTLGMLALAAGGLTVLEDYFSLKQVARAIVRHAGPEALVTCHGLPADNPSLLFYMDRQISWVEGDPRMEFATRERGIGRGLYLSDADFVQGWHSSRETYLIAEESTVEGWTRKLGLSAAQQVPFARSGTRVALVNRVQH